MTRRTASTSMPSTSMEAFNVFNRANFDPGLFNSSFQPNASVLNINSPTFGQIKNTFDPRILQFAARFEF